MLNEYSNEINLFAIIITMVGIGTTIYISYNFKEIVLKVIVFLELKDYSHIIIKVADKYKKDEKYQKAISLYKEGLKLGNNDIDTFLNLSRCYKEIKDFKNANLIIDDLITNVEENSCNIESEKKSIIYAVKTAILYESNEIKDALFFINKSIFLNQEDFSYFLIKGQILQILGEHEECIESLKVAIRLNKTYAISYLLLAQSLRELYLYKDVVKYCKTALHYDNKLARAKTTMEIVLDILNRYGDGPYPLEKEKPILDIASLDLENNKLSDRLNNKNIIL